MKIKTKLEQMSEQVRSLYHSNCVLRVSKPCVLRFVNELLGLNGLRPHLMFQDRVYA